MRPALCGIGSSASPSDGISNAIIILSTIIVNAIRYKDSCIKTFDINSVYEIWYADSVVLSLRRVKPLKDKTMKTILYILFAATMMAGCNNSEATKGFDSVDATRFAEVIENEQVQIIDTRTPAEFSEGHIPGAVNIDINGEEFAAKVAELDKSRPVAVYCRGGRRSKEAAKHMVSCGFEVTELSEGILSWTGEVEK